jgi:hypothetical protein
MAIMTFLEFLADLKLQELKTEDRVLQQVTKLFEHKVYKPITGTRDTYREDPENTNTLTMRHSHVYAGDSKNQLYAVNMDGTGHDGSSGESTPSKHAEFFRQKGYKINPNNILEELNVTSLLIKEHVIYIFDASE